MESKFRLNAQSLFMTYAQCDLAPEDLLSHLQGAILKRAWKIVQYVIAREKHEDGNNHLHAFIKLDKKVNIGDPKIFDILGHHPNM